MSLEGGHLRWPTKSHATGFCPCPALVRPSLDQMALECRQPGQNRNHQLAVRRGRIRPWVAQRFELGADLGHPPLDGQQIESRPCQPIEPCHDQHITRTDRLQELSEFNSIRLRPGHLLAIDARAPGRFQPADLPVVILAIGRDPRLTDDSHFLVP